MIDDGAIPQTPDLNTYQVELAHAYNSVFDIIAAIAENEPEGLEPAVNEMLGLPYKATHHMGSALALMNGTPALNGGDHRFYDAQAVSIL